MTGEGVVGLNTYAKTYPFEATFTATTGGKAVTYTVSGDAGNKQNIISPDTELFNVSGELSGTYKNPNTSQDEDMKLMYKAYEPAALLEDGAKNPLIIWLHGAGEGGQDPDICILGNKVSALAKDPIQSHFSTDGGAGGAYVLVVQCATMWMDVGDSAQGAGDAASRYTQILRDAILKYLGENTDVDTSRVYVGGCSNGGYMTMNMLVEYPELFAAAYPNCEAYAYFEYEKNADGTYKDGRSLATSTRWMTDEKINRVKDKPIWFVHSADDWVVDPRLTALPTYRALLDAGADNVWFSYFENVVGTDDPEANQNVVISPQYSVGPGYMGHFSWIYTLNDQVTGVQDPKAIATSEDSENLGFVPNNRGGGSAKAQGTYENLFDWMNSQHQ
jgi:predicted esterase